MLRDCDEETGSSDMRAEKIYLEPNDRFRLPRRFQIILFDIQVLEMASQVSFRRPLDSAPEVGGEGGLQWL